MKTNIARLTHCVATFALALGFGTGIGVAQAAPNMEIVSLPMDPKLAADLAANGLDDDQITEFQDTITRISVYADHKNPRELEGLDNRNTPKIFYAAPYFQPNQARSVVGTEVFSDYALEIIDEADALFRAFNFQATELVQLTLRLAAVNRQNDNVTGALCRTGLSVAENQRLQAILDRLLHERDNIQAAIDRVRSAGADGASVLDASLRQELSSEIVLQLSRLGFAPNDSERALLSSSDPTQWSHGLASLRARAGNGQFGFRQSIMESGYTDHQRQVLATYLKLRPDVSTRSLSVQTVYAKPTPQTAFVSEGLAQTEPSMVIYRGVNLANGGKCGSARTCNVVVEYTQIGARLTRVLTGPVQFPVTFEADVKTAMPRFKGMVSCHYVLGWRAAGRADIRDGREIYDGDLTNTIKFDPISNTTNGCDVKIDEGDEDSAFYHILMEFNRQWTDYGMERTKASLSHREAYEDALNARLEQQRRDAETADRPVGVLGAWERFWTGSTSRGDFYWSTTILDISSVESIDFTQSFDVNELAKTVRYSFDGFPMVCYGLGADFTTTMQPCRDADRSISTTEVDSGSENCPETDILGNCL